MNAEKLAYDEFVSPPWAGENADDFRLNVAMASLRQENWICWSAALEVIAPWSNSPALLNGLRGALWRGSRPFETLSERDIYLWLCESEFVGRNLGADRSPAEC
jgi:hypothetical protein